MVRMKVVVGAAAFVLAVVAFAALAGDVEGQPSSRGFTTELESSDKLRTFEQKLANDKAKFDSVSHRLDEIKKAEDKIKHEQSALLKKEAAAREIVHTVRNRVVAEKYKIHNMKAVAFSNAMFGLSTKSNKKAQAHAKLEHKARALEDEREKELEKEELEKEDAVQPERRGQSGRTQESDAQIIAQGLKKAKAQMDALRKQAKARAAAALKKKSQLEKEREASQTVDLTKMIEQKELKQAKARASAALQMKALQLEKEREASQTVDLTKMIEEKEREAVEKRRQAALTRQLVSRMQAEVLRKRVVAMAATTPKTIRRMNMAPMAKRIHTQQAKRGTPQMPPTLEQKAEFASENAMKAQKMAFMRSPQFWATQQAPRTMKTYGLMPSLPLLSPLDPAAADK
jgi:hypothetical protein